MAFLISAWNYSSSCHIANGWGRDFLISNLFISSKIFLTTSASTQRSPSCLHLYLPSILGQTYRTCCKELCGPHFGHKDDMAELYLARLCEVGRRSYISFGINDMCRDYILQSSFQDTFLCCMVFHLGQKPYWTWPTASDTCDSSSLWTSKATRSLFYLSEALDHQVISLWPIPLLFACVASAILMFQLRFNITNSITDWPHTSSFDIRSSIMYDLIMRFSQCHVQFGFSHLEFFNVDAIGRDTLAWLLYRAVLLRLWGKLSHFHICTLMLCFICSTWDNAIS